MTPRTPPDHMRKVVFNPHNLHHSVALTPANPAITPSTLQHTDGGATGNSSSVRVTQFLDINTSSTQHSASFMCTLKPMNLHDVFDFEELRQQRVLCGWNYAEPVLIQWREMMDVKQKALFWIFSIDGMKTVGHISLDSTSEVPDLELANPDKSVLTIATFFIKSEWRELGLGRAAMDILEDWATKAPYGSPNCRYIAINTLSKKYIEDDAAEWRGIWAKLGKSTPSKGRSVQSWYESRGYVKWKEQPKYLEKTLDGHDIKLIAVYLRKYI